VTTPEAINARQPEESDEHIANLAETVADAIRRGLRPTGEAEHVSTEPSPPGHVLATYRVPVGVTPSAATVSAEGEQENDPEQTTLDAPAPDPEPVAEPAPEWPAEQAPAGTDTPEGA
jgi:hypothetical protein